MTIDDYEYLYVMDEMDLQLILVSMMPIIKMREENERHYYMLGTEVKEIQIKTDRLFIRVGGGYSTLQEYLEQNGAFECIKIYKIMRDQQCSFKQAVKFYLEKNKASKRVMTEYVASCDDNQLELFENAINLLKQKQDEVNRRYSRGKSRSSMSGKSTDRNVKKSKTMGSAGQTAKTTATSTSPKG